MGINRAQCRPQINWAAEAAVVAPPEYADRRKERPKHSLRTARAVRLIGRVQYHSPQSR